MRLMESECELMLKRSATGAPNKMQECLPIISAFGSVRFGIWVLELI